MQRKHRIFVAINLPDDIKRELVKYHKKWLELPAKWTNFNNLHITLEFLGDLTDEELGEVCVSVKEAVVKHNSFNINLNKVLYGPPGLRSGQVPKMIWVMGDRPDELLSLKTDLQRFLLKTVRFAPEKRTSLLHVTLAKIREWEWKKIEPEERPEINENIDFTFTVESIEVMESVLKRGGPEYTIIESYNLT